MQQENRLAGKGALLAEKEPLLAGKVGRCGEKERLRAHKERRRVGKKLLLIEKERLLAVYASRTASSRCGFPSRWTVPCTSGSPQSPRSSYLPGA